MEAHGDSLMPQPGSHRHNAYRPRARPRWGHVAPTGWSVAGVGGAAEISRCWSCCVQIGYKGRFAFFRLATEPRNHAVSFRPFHSGRALCFRFGHRVRCRGRFGHRAPLLPGAYPDQTRFRHQASLARVVGPPPGSILRRAAGDIPCGRVQSAPGGGIRRRRGQESGPPTRETPPAVRKGHRPRRMPPSAARRRPGVYG